MAKSPDPTAGSELKQLLTHGVKDIYYAEKKIYRALPKMIRAAHDQGLKDALSTHREETQGQIEKLERVFEIMGLRPRGEKCDAIDGILEESASLLEDFGETSACDAAIIFACQGVEHYEINRYGSMHMYAKELGLGDIQKLLAEILAEEKNADVTLTKIAVQRVNFAAN